jgi:addiction module RelE/StbE family toxin
MEISFSSSFKKSFRKRIKGTACEGIFWAAVELFIEDPQNQRLKPHKLSGKLKGLWSFSVEYDVRVVFYFTNDKPQKAVFVDIGNHDEVY